MKQRMKFAHMRAAYIYADLSYAKRKKVGCIVVEHDRTISIGYNGTPSGEDNNCEDENGETKSNVIHAEDNAIRKLERENISAEGAYLFCTAEPCLNCSEKIVAAKIKKVFYHQSKPDRSGVQFMIDSGIQVEQLTVDQ